MLLSTELREYSGWINGRVNNSVWNLRITHKGSYCWYLTESHSCTLFEIGVLFRCRSHHLYLTESRSSLKLRSIWAHYSQRFVLPVSHGISLSLNPPQAAVKFDSPTGSGRDNNSVRLTRLAHKSSRSIETHRISSSLHPPPAVVALNSY